MRYVVLGAGAIGGGVGGLLQLAGVPTTLIARGDHLDILRRDGLGLTSGHEQHVVDIAAVGSPAEVEWTDDTVVLLAVKSQQTEAVLPELVAAAHPRTPVVSMQNGVANERTLLRYFDQVHGVCVMMPASHLEAGHVQIHSANVPGLLDIGRYPGGTDAVDKAVADDLRTAGFECVPREDIMAWKHRKLLMNLSNGVDAACVDDDAAAELSDRCIAEGEQVLAAAGIETTSQALDLARRGELLRPMVDREDAGSSTWQSVKRATGNVEVDYLNGEIVLLGRLHGVATPANELVRRTVDELARGRGEVGAIDAGGLLAQLG